MRTLREATEIRKRRCTNKRISSAALSRTQIVSVEAWRGGKGLEIDGNVVRRWAETVRSRYVCAGWRFST
jgi:hypothetical protein